MKELSIYECLSLDDTENIKLVLRLAKKEKPKLENKIINNRSVIHAMTVNGNKLQRERAERHLIKNTSKLNIIQTFINEHT